MDPAGTTICNHVTPLQRLLHHVPPATFIVSGLRAPVYHYFDDLLRARNALHLGETEVFDLFY